MPMTNVTGADGANGADGNLGSPAGAPGQNGAAASSTLNYGATFGDITPDATQNMFGVKVAGGFGGRGGDGFIGLAGASGGAGGAGGAALSRLTNINYSGSLDGVAGGQTVVRSSAVGGDGGDSGMNGLGLGSVAGDGGKGGQATAQLDALHFHLTGGDPLVVEAVANGGMGGVSATTLGQAGDDGNGGAASAVMQNTQLTGSLPVIKLNVEATGGDGANGGDASASFRNNSIVLDSVQRIDITLDAQGGAATAVGGADGAASVQFTGNDIHLGATIGGSTQLRLFLPDYHDASVDISGNVFDGGVGVDYLNLNSGTTNAVLFDMNQNTVTGFEYIAAGGGDDTLIGDSANSVFQGNAGNDLIDGGGGIDTAILGGDLADFQITRSGAGDYLVTDLRTGSPAGVDHLVGVEKVQFDDGTYFLGLLSGGHRIDGTAADEKIDATHGPKGQLHPGAGDDVLFGNAGDDTLDGGAGADVMQGGSGDDTYVVDNRNDAVSEAVNDGLDTVKASVDFNLGANFEKLILTGTAAINGAGNELDNTVTGNAAANHLSGGAGKDIIGGAAGDDVITGGAGADTLTGGAGADHFVFDVLGPAADKDTIKDFVHGTDHLDFSDDAFAALFGGAGGVLAASEFATGAAATTSAQHLIYNTSSGALFYDADGVGGATQVQIAVLTGHPVLAASDILVI